MKMSSAYNTRLFDALRLLESDYSSKRLSRDEFAMLLGLYIEREVSKFVKHEFDSLVPPEENSFEGRFLTYNRERSYTHG